MRAAAENPPDGHAHAGAETHGEGAHAASIRDLLFPAINFSIYLVIVVRFVVPAMQEYLRRRRSEATQTVSDAREALARAEREVGAAKARLGSLPSEADRIRQDLLAIATRQAERSIARAEESGRRRLADAALMAEHERRRALASVRAEIAAAATGIAERKIRAALTPDDQRSFVQQFLKDAAVR